MPRTTTTYDIFVCRPSDVKEQVNVLEEEVIDINMFLTKNAQKELNIINYEIDIAPGVDKYPQNVINKAITNKYDIFIAIFSHRLGSPTNKSKSGSVEEVHNAIKSRNDNGIPEHILIYFNNGGVNLSEIDTGQLDALRDFKSSLSSMGVLYKEYSNIDDFRHKIKNDLINIVNTKEIDSTDISLSVTDEDVEIDVLEEYGFLDLVDMGVEEFEKLSISTKNITDAIEDLGNHFNKRTDEINNISGIKDERGKSLLFRRIADKAASDMELFSDRCNAELPIFRDRLHSGIDFYGKSVVMIEKFHIPNENTDEIVDQLNSANESIHILIDGMKKGIEPTLSFIETMEDFPGMTSTFIKQRNAAVSVLKSIANNLETGLSALNEINKSISDSIYRIREAAGQTSD